jgi:magnesium-transporting ATPase (P-type)
MLFAGIVFGIFLTILMSALLYGKIVFYEHTFQADFATMFLLICVSLLLYAIMNLSMFPILFKIGYARGKALGFYIPVGVSMVVIYFSIFLWNYNDSIRGRLISVFEWSLANTIWAVVIIVAVSVIFFSISYALSQRVFSKREF